MDGLFHVIEAQQFSREVMKGIFDLTREMEQVVSRYGSNILNRRIMATLFYEPSTRTRLSFEAAMYRLDGDGVIGMGDFRILTSQFGDGKFDDAK